MDLKYFLHTCTTFFIILHLYDRCLIFIWFKKQYITVQPCKRCNFITSETVCHDESIPECSLNCLEQFLGRGYADEADGDNVSEHVSHHKHYNSKYL